MKNPFLLKVWLPAGITISLLILSSCVSLPTDNHEHSHEDEEAVGLTVYSLNSEGGIENLIVQQTFAGIEGSFLIGTGTSNFKIFFLAEDGDEFIPDLSEHSIEVEVTGNPDAVTLTRTANNSDDSLFSLAGRVSGEAAIAVILKHQGAREFVSKPLPITIIL